MGVPRSLPPCILKPHGDPPSNVTCLADILVQCSGDILCSSVVHVN